MDLSRRADRQPHRSAACAAVDRIARGRHGIGHPAATTTRRGNRDRARRRGDRDVGSSGERLVLEGPAGVRNAEELVSGANRRQASAVPGDGRHARRGRHARHGEQRGERDSLVGARAGERRVADVEDLDLVGGRVGGEKRFFRFKVRGLGFLTVLS